nr:immunoglobulin light chain junction region [Macaca mulatta]MOX10246.1 immunoglobulin light chain junction region [Macaca mulatta]
CQRCDTAPWTF